MSSKPCPMVPSLVQTGQSEEAVTRRSKNRYILDHRADFDLDDESDEGYSAMIDQYSHLNMHL